MHKLWALTGLAIPLSLAAAVASWPAGAQTNGPGDWDTWTWSWYGPLHMVAWLLILALVIVGVVRLIRGMAPPMQSPQTASGPSPGLKALDERYARGEIKRDEYLQKRSDINGR